MRLASSPSVFPQHHRVAHIERPTSTQLLAMPPPANAPSVPVHKNLLPVTADSPVAIAADHEMVTRTEFLSWSTPTGQPPQRHLPERILTKMFLPPCDLHPITGPPAKFSTFNPLTFRLTEAAWSRIRI